MLLVLEFLIVAVWRRRWSISPPSRSITPLRRTRSCLCGCSRRPGKALLSFVLVLSILVPIMAIGLGLDSINGEYN